MNTGGTINLVNNIVIVKSTILLTEYALSEHNSPIDMDAANYEGFNHVSSSRM